MSDTCSSCDHWTPTTAECTHIEQRYESYLFLKMNLITEFQQSRYKNTAGYNYSCSLYQNTKPKILCDMSHSPLPRNGMRREIVYVRALKSKRRVVWALENMMLKRLMTQYSKLYRDKWLYQWGVMLDYPERLLIKETKR